MTQQQIKHIFAVGTLIVALTLVMAILGEIEYQRQESTAGKHPTGLVVGESANVAPYAPPFDPYAGPGTQLATMTMIDLGSDFRAGLTITQPQGYIWHTGYYLRNGKWVAFEFPQATGEWASPSASYTITLPEADYLRFPDDDFYVAFYSCKYYTDTWRCGCKDNNGDCGHWMVQSGNIHQPLTQYAISVSPREQASTLSWITANINISENPATSDVYGFDFNISYDSTRLSASPVGFGHGEFLGPVGYPGNLTPADFACVTPDVSTPGLITNIACTRLGTPVAGTNSMVRTITFQKIGTGYAQINITGAEIVRWSDFEQEPAVEYWAMNNNGARILS